MSKARKKYYTVWAGRQPGVYDDWDDAREQVENFPGAKFKSFSTPQEAAEAYRMGEGADGRELGRLLIQMRQRELSAQADTILSLDEKKRRFPEIDGNAWAVDAACAGNPGRMEYQCIDLATGARVFHLGPLDGATNNIGEFLAIVHAIALMEQRGLRLTLYSDSRTGMAWVRRCKANTKIDPRKANPKVIELINRAEQWLLGHTFRPPIRKWQTEEWGEIPADFGRK